MNQIEQNQDVPVMQSGEALPNARSYSIHLTDVGFSQCLCFNVCTTHPLLQKELVLDFLFSSSSSFTYLSLTGLFSFLVRPARTHLIISFFLLDIC